MYMVFGHVVVYFVAFVLGVNALNIKSAEVVWCFWFDGRFGFLSLERGRFLLSTICSWGVASSSGSFSFSSCYAFIPEAGAPIRHVSCPSPLWTYLKMP